jgi:hypothetical protein
MLDKKANIFKVQYLYGKHRRICGGHKCESLRSYPGRPAYSLLEELGKPEGGSKCMQESADGIVKQLDRKSLDVSDRTRPLEDRERKEGTLRVRTGSGSSRRPERGSVASCKLKNFADHAKTQKWAETQHTPAE